MRKSPIIAGAIRALAMIGMVGLTTGSEVRGQGPAGTTMTYQGKLEDLGAAASGNFDMVFALYDAATGGSQVASVSFCGTQPIPVTAGLFTAELDFGASAFSGNARWLEIRVRPATGGCQGCGGQCPYTTLTPRQPVTATPYAVHALNAHWEADGTAITNGNSGFVGINRTQPVTGAEVFGLYSAGASYGGMYIETPVSGQPFYGYSAGGDVDAYHYVNGSTGNWHLTVGASPRMTVEPGGNVGIGTTNPATTLHVAGVATIQDALFQEEVNFSDGARFQGGGLIVDGPSPGGATDHSVSIYANTAGQTLRAHNDGLGKAGLFLLNNPANNLYAVEGLTAGTGIAVHGHTTGNGVAGYFVNRSAANPKAALYCRTDGSGLALQVDGTAQVGVLEIMGADVAERFPVSEPMEPGMVVEIDPENAGRLRVARGAYNRRVAGVVSGAGDLPVGAILGNLPGHEDAPPIALSGRVWVRCDATLSAVAPGDLLTTADLPGHAMKASVRERSHGAVIGKAMTGLAAGETGLVLVLVNLQ